MASCLPVKAALPTTKKTWRSECCAGNFPKHRTRCDFRSLHLKELAGLFVQVVKLARECGLVKLGTIAVDGTKLRASASKHKAMSYEGLDKARCEFKLVCAALNLRRMATMAI